MHQNLAVILRQFNYSKISFIVLVPGVKREDGATTLDTFHKWPNKIILIVLYFSLLSRVTRCKSKKEAQMLLKVALIVATSVYTYCYLFSKYPKKSTIYFISKCVDKNFQKSPNLVTLFPRPSIVRLNMKNYGQWLWHSWQRGRLRYQKTQVRINSWRTFIEQLKTICRKYENQRKRGREWSIFEIWKNLWMVHEPLITQSRIGSLW